MRRLALSPALWLGLVIGAAAQTPPDPRVMVPFPPDIREQLLAEMRGHMDQLNTLITFVAAGDMAGAAKFAATGLALAGAGHAPGAARPGWFAPQEFRALGWAMHEAAGKVAEAAGKSATPPGAADYRAVTEALAGLTATCSGCHGSFRVR